MAGSLLGQRTAHIGLLYTNTDDALLFDPGGLLNQSKSGQTENRSVFYVGPPTTTVRVSYLRVAPLIYLSVIGDKQASTVVQWAKDGTRLYQGRRSPDRESVKQTERDGEKKKKTPGNSDQQSPDHQELNRVRSICIASVAAYTHHHICGCIVCSGEDVSQSSADNKKAGGHGRGRKGGIARREQRRDEKRSSRLATEINL
ncbi:hypothetical protein OUZ56_021854 [Daphnia magna]|uniref:Uncharacterized protein n=1 Tax=Daphnia magna TaxID=35525 RepID=A0ABR0AUN3_9CRUS|nr:hypothetical protein OUZ56_021854 [Daphnia magna]